MYVHFSYDSHEVFQEVDILPKNHTQYISTQEDHRVDEEATENYKDLDLIDVYE